MALSSEVDKIVSDVANKIGIPKSVWYPILMLESQGNPNTRNYVSPAEAKIKHQGPEDSRGLFQVNIYSYPEANSSKLFDPKYNAEFQLKNLKPFYDEAINKGLKGSDIAKYVQRYGQKSIWNSDISSALDKYYNLLNGMSTGNSKSKPLNEQTPSDIWKAFESGEFNPANSDAVIKTEGTEDSSLWGGFTFAGVTRFVGYEVLIVLIMAFVLFSLYVAFVRGGGSIKSQIAKEVLG